MEIVQSQQRNNRNSIDDIIHKLKSELSLDKLLNNLKSNHSKIMSVKRSINNNYDDQTIQHTLNRDGSSTLIQKLEDRKQIRLNQLDAASKKYYGDFSNKNSNQLQNHIKPQNEVDSSSDYGWSPEKEVRRYSQRVSNNINESQQHHSKFRIKNFAKNDLIVQPSQNNVVRINIDQDSLNHQSKVLSVSGSLDKIDQQQLRTAANLQIQTQHLFSDVTQDKLVINQPMKLMNNFMNATMNDLSSHELIKSQDTTTNLILDHIDDVIDYDQHQSLQKSFQTSNRQSVVQMKALVEDQMQLFQNNSILSTKSKSFFQVSRAKKNWIKLQNVLKGINLLRRNIVMKIQDPDELEQNLKQYTSRHSNSIQNLQKEIEQETRKEDLAESDKTDIQCCQIINRLNNQRKTPLYVACSHGNLDVVQFLLNNNADPYKLSQAGNYEWESVLQVTARWSHVRLFEYLLQNIKWERREILFVLKMKRINPAIRRLAREYSKKNKQFKMAKAGGKFEMLNEVQIAEIREIFTLFDKNSDGYVNTSELGTIVRGLYLNPSEAEVVEMMRDVDPNNTGSFDQNSLISLIARKGKSQETLEEMIENLKELVDQSDDKEKEKMKLSVEQFKFNMMNMGEKMLEHQVEEILTDSDLVFEDQILIDEFAKYIMSR
eukprot:403360168